MKSFYGGPFHTAAVRLQFRYAHRYGWEKVYARGFHVTFIKERWYKRKTCQIVRTRFGGATQ